MPQVYSTYRYTFDRVYGPDATQEEVYEHSARDSVKQVLEVMSVVQICSAASEYEPKVVSVSPHMWGLRNIRADGNAGVQCGNHCVWADRHRQDIHHGRGALWRRYVRTHSFKMRNTRAEAGISDAELSPHA